MCTGPYPLGRWWPSLQRCERTMRICQRKLCSCAMRYTFFLPPFDHHSGPLPPAHPQPPCYLNSLSTSPSIHRCIHPSYIPPSPVFCLSFLPLLSTVSTKNSTKKQCTMTDDNDHDNNQNDVAWCPAENDKHSENQELESTAPCSCNLVVNLDPKLLEK